MPMLRMVSISMLVATVNVWGSGCGGVSTKPTPALPASGTTVNVTLTNAAPGIAVRIGAGNWAPVSVAANQQLNFTVPDGINSYAIAWACPVVGVSPDNTSQSAFVFEATIQDPTSYTESCAGGPGVVEAAVTGSVDASAIPNTTGVNIVGSGGVQGASLVGPVGTFNASLITGLNDIAAVAVDASNNVLAVKIVRSQNVPGVVNGGNPITFTASDATKAQPVSVTNDPWGSLPSGAVNASFITANGTSFAVKNANTAYWAISSSEAQSGDYYSFSTTANNQATGQAITITQTSTGAGAVTLSLPAPLANSAPTPAPFPNFNMSYSALSTNNVSGYGASISWNASGQMNAFNWVGLGVVATSAFQNGGNTLAIPDFGSIPGFLGYDGGPTSGTLIHWHNSIWGGLMPPVSNSGWSVNNSGTYIEP